MAGTRDQADAATEPARGSADALLEYDLRQMWLSLMRRPWTSLAVVPSDADVSAATATQVLAEMARTDEFEPFVLIRAEGASVTEGTRLARNMEVAISAGSRVVVTVDALTSSLGGVPLVRDASFVVLVVRKGDSRLEAVTSTMEMVGADRVLGCVLLPARRPLPWWRRLFRRGEPR